MVILQRETLNEITRPGDEMRPSLNFSIEFLSFHIIMNKDMSYYLINDRNNVFLFFFLFFLILSYSELITLYFVCVYFFIVSFKEETI